MKKHKMMLLKIKHNQKKSDGRNPQIFADLVIDLGGNPFSCEFFEGDYISILTEIIKQIKEE